MLVEIEVDRGPQMAAAAGYEHRDGKGFTCFGPRFRGDVDVEQGRGRLTLWLEGVARYEEHEPVVLFAIAAVADEVLRRGGTVLHAATVEIGGQATAVAGPSGSGKSTLAKRFGAAHLHEEHAFLVPASGGWEFWRLPQFRGPWDRERPMVLPVGAALRLGPERGRTAARALRPADAFAALAPCAFRMAGASREWLDGLARLAEEVPVGWLDHCLETPIEEVAAVMAGVGRGA
jgi:hypothetical protein